MTRMYASKYVPRVEVKAVRSACKHVSFGVQCETLTYDILCAKHSPKLIIYNDYNPAPLSEGARALLKNAVAIPCPVGRRRASMLCEKPTTHQYSDTG